MCSCCTAILSERKTQRWTFNDGEGIFDSFFFKTQRAVPYMGKIKSNKTHYCLGIQWKTSELNFFLLPRIRQLFRQEIHVISVELRRSGNEKIAQCARKSTIRTHSRLFFPMQDQCLPEIYYSAEKERKKLNLSEDKKKNSVKKSNKCELETLVIDVIDFVKGALYFCLCCCWAICCPLFIVPSIFTCPRRSANLISSFTLTQYQPK